MRLAEIAQAPLGDGDDEPDYRGNEGWLLIAVGTNGQAVLLDYDGAFGAFCYAIDSCGGSPEDLGVEDLPEDPGLYWGHFKVWTTSVHDYDGSDNDMGFSLVGEWVDYVAAPKPEAEVSDA